MKPRASLTLAALLALAACTGRLDAPRDQAAAPGDSASAARSLAPGSSPAGVNERWARLPDFADPRTFLRLDSLDWRAWESPVRGDRRQVLESLGIRLLRPAESEGQRVEHFHFVDFSGDGVADVVYDGPAFQAQENGEVWPLEGSRLTFWQVVGVRAVEVFDHHATLQRVWRGRPGEPLSFRAVQYGCCAETYIQIEYYTPERRGDTVRYRPGTRILHSQHHPAPERWFPRARPFEVAQDRYTLRFTPAIDPEREFEWGRGNVSAEYRRGARGVALGETTDATGRVWWLVLMDGRTPPTSTAPSPEVPGDGVPQDRLGWMSSRFVTETGSAP